MVLEGKEPALLPPGKNSMSETPAIQSQLHLNLLIPPGKQHFSNMSVYVFARGTLTKSNHDLLRGLSFDDMQLLSGFCIVVGTIFTLSHYWNWEDLYLLPKLTSGIRRFHINIL